MCRQRSSPARLESSSVTFGCLYQDCEGLWWFGHRRSISYRLTTSLINHRNYVSDAFDLFCRMRKSSTPPHSIRFWLVQLRGTHDPGHSPSPLLIPMPISRCCHASLSLFSLYFSVLSHAARITQVHPSCDPTVRIRSVDV